jgi:ribosomal protein S6--L-glutamate ligase
MGRLRVAIGEQLTMCPQVITLGVRSQVADYTVQERRLLREADIVFHPTNRFVDHLAVLDKETFPSLDCYRLLGDRRKQISLLRMLDIGYPRTRVYYGHKQKKNILRDFTFPLIAKRVRGSVPGRSIFFIDDEETLKWYTKHYNPAFIQEYVPAEQVFLVVILNYNRILGCWRKVNGGTPERAAIRSIRGKKDVLESKVLESAIKIATGGHLSDVAVEIIFDGAEFWVSEIYFQYEERSELHLSKERIEVVLEMIEQGEL